MTAVLTPPAPAVRPISLPDHTQLPETDGAIVNNFEELPQSMLLSDSIGPVLDKRQPDGQYCIGQDSGIYWQVTDPPLDGCKAPDWYYVPDVPPRLEGECRRSYVLWQEIVAPLIILEYVSGDGTEERDRTPRKGKFWVYERAVKAPYYGIFESSTAHLEMYRLIDSRYVRMEPNEHGRYAIVFLGVELGVWQGRGLNQQSNWMRWWDADGNMLLTGWERVELEQREKEMAEREAEKAQQQAAQAQQQTERERAEKVEIARRAERLAERLRELGVDPTQL